MYGVYGVCLAKLAAVGYFTPMSELGVIRTKRPKTGGRQKGTPNKVTGTLKEAILRAADEAGGSGGVVEYLTLQAHENPAAFMGLLGKVLPMQVNHGGSVATAAPDLSGMDAAQAAAAYTAFVKLTDGSGGA